MLLVSITIIFGVVALLYFVSRNTTVDITEEDGDGPPITLYVGEEGDADVVVSKIDKEMDEYVKMSQGSDFIYISRDVDKFFRNDSLNFLLIQKASRYMCILFHNAITDNNKVSQINSHLAILPNTAIVSIAHLPDSTKYRFVHIIGDYELKHSILSFDLGHVLIPTKKDDDLFKMPPRVVVDQDPLSPPPSAPPPPSSLQMPFEEPDKFGIRDDTKIVYMRSKKSRVPAVVSTVWNLFIN